MSYSGNDLPIVIDQYTDVRLGTFRIRYSPATRTFMVAKLEQPADVWLPIAKLKPDLHSEPGCDDPYLVKLSEWSRLAAVYEMTTR